jgi:hypothetical protein
MVQVKPELQDELLPGSEPPTLAALPPGPALNPAPGSKTKSNSRDVPAAPGSPTKEAPDLATADSECAEPENRAGSPGEPLDASPRSGLEEGSSKPEPVPAAPNSPTAAPRRNSPSPPASAAPLRVPAAGGAVPREPSGAAAPGPAQATKNEAEAAEQAQPLHEPAAELASGGTADAVVPPAVPDPLPAAAAAGAPAPDIPASQPSTMAVKVESPANPAPRSKHRRKGEGAWQHVWGPEGNG